jgi:hypothetical protein
MSRFLTRLLSAVSALVFVFSICASAQAQGDPGKTQDSVAMSDRVQQLEKQLIELKSELAAIKAGGNAASTSPALPASLPASDIVATTTTPADAPKSSSLASILGPTSVSGFVDMYYGQNFNNPASRNTGLRSFDFSNNQFSLNLIELVVDKTPDPNNSRTGYRIALGYGQAMNAIYAAGTGASFSADQYVKEAYFSYLAPVGKGLQIDAGKFVTPHGAEVIETKDNINYSRGLLFSYAIPYYHFGLRAKYAFSDKYSLTGFLVNGWNNTIDNNSGKTIGLTFGWNPTKKLSVTQCWMGGPEQPNDNRSKRQMFDTVVNLAVTPRLTLGWNFDYGRGDRVTTSTKPVWWTGVASYAKYALNNKYSIATRYEYYNDHYGFTTGTAGHIQEVTGTFEHPMATHILTRLEFRHDMANNPVFTKGASTPVREQTTMTAGLVFLFDSREGTK